jgi:hypothetical protein
MNKNIVKQVAGFGKTTAVLVVANLVLGAAEKGVDKLVEMYKAKKEKEANEQAES